MSVPPDDDNCVAPVDIKTGKMVIPHVPPAPMMVQQNATNITNVTVTPELKGKLLGQANEYDAAMAELAGCSTDVEVLQLELRKVASCMAIAAEIYQTRPVADNAFQLAALTSAYNNTFNLLTKQKDPKKVAEDLAGMVKAMFVKIVHAFAIEVDKTKKDLISRHPTERSTIEDHFFRLLEAIQPETQKIFDGYEQGVRSALGIK